MRADIVSGAVFPDYELADHTAKRRKLSELQEQHPLILILSRGGYCPRIAASMKGWCNFIVKSRSAIAVWSESAPTISPKRTNIAAVWVLTGPSSPTRDAKFKKISTLLNILTRFTIP